MQVITGGFLNIMCQDMAMIILQYFLCKACYRYTDSQCVIISLFLDEHSMNAGSNSYSGADGYRFVLQVYSIQAI